MEKNEFEDEVINETEEETLEDEAKTEDEAPDYKKLYEAEVGKRKRYEKDAKQAKEAKKETPAESDNEVKLSTSEMLALVKAEVADEDIEEIMEYAKFKKISIKEAINSNYIKTTLKEKAEMRKSQELAYSGTSRKGTQSVSPTAVYEKAKHGGTLSEAELEKLASL
jgi:hypothetical protein